MKLTSVHKKEFEKFGININNSDEEIIEEVVEKLSLFSDIAEYTEYDFFRREMKRIQLPTN